MIINKIQYNPDVLDALANLSSDEVFTPPKIANEMLDLLPNEIWSDSSIKILDPASKSGVFLREAAKRFIDGLEKEIPDLQKRINHIMTKQLFGIGITNLTSLLSRRSLYCSKNAKYDPNDDLGKYSICSEFLDSDGNIRFDRIEHERENGSCKYCGASQEEYQRDEYLETHAYGFLHFKEAKIKDLFSLDKTMRFDVIIGNPPYQLTDGGAGASAKPIYNKFVEAAKKMNPRYLCMIVPSRWFAGGKGLDSFRDEMLKDHHMKYIKDFPNANMCFPGVEIAGGVNYFLWESGYDGDCEICTVTEKGEDSMVRKLDQYDVFVRWNKGISIIEKVQKLKEDVLGDIASSRKPFGLATNFTDFDDEEGPDKYKIYSSNQVGVRKVGYTKKDNITKGLDLVKKWKVLMPKAYRIGSATDGGYIHPIISEPGSVCTETFIVLSTFKSEKEAINFANYIKTRFFRFLVSLRKVTQDATAKVYGFVPMQDFSESWTDEKLYKKYKLTDDEINYIELMINPMD